MIVDSAIKPVIAPGQEWKCPRTNEIITILQRFGDSYWKISSSMFKYSNYMSTKFLLNECVLVFNEHITSRPIDLNEAGFLDSPAYDETFDTHVEAQSQCCDVPNIVQNHASGKFFYVCKNCKQETDKNGGLL